MTTVPTIAAFDFDGTLTTADSVVPFLARVAGRRRLAAAVLRHAFVNGSAVARRDRDALRAVATSAVFRGRSHADVIENAERHAEAILAARLRDDTVGRLHWHREHDHRIVIVSASYRDYVAPVAAALGVGDVLATTLEVGDDGRCTGRLDGANCRGAEKVRRLERWWATLGWQRSEIDLWAYGDSAGDDEMLAAADHPVRVDRTMGSVAASPTA